jgi:hypothetical protein
MDKMGASSIAQLVRMFMDFERRTAETAANGNRG